MARRKRRAVSLTLSTNPHIKMNSNEKLECIKTADVLQMIVNDLKKLNEDFLIQEVKNVFLVQYDYEYTGDRLWYIFTDVR